MKITVIGANGQLGGDIVSAFIEGNHEVRALTHADVELSSLDSVRSCLHSDDSEIVVNTAAMHNVEKCEQDPQTAFAVNAIGARNLAIVTRDVGASIVHISTDYVFDGVRTSPYIETDVPKPLNIYGNSKLAGEHFVQTLNPKHFVVRTSALYGKSPCRAKNGLNFVDLMLKLGRERGRVRVIDSEFVSPTATADLASQIVRLAETNEYGLYHATAEGSCSWYEFAREIFIVADVAVKVEVATPEEFPAKVLRPRYSVLENLQLKARHLNLLEPWEAGLTRYLAGKEVFASPAAPPSLSSR